MPTRRRWVSFSWRGWWSAPVAAHAGPPPVGLRWQSLSLWLAWTASWNVGEWAILIDPYALCLIIASPIYQVDNMHVKYGTIRTASNMYQVDNIHVKYGTIRTRLRWRRLTALLPSSPVSANSWRKFWQTCVPVCRGLAALEITKRFLGHGCLLTLNEFRLRGLLLQDLREDYGTGSMATS